VEAADHLEVFHDGERAEARELPEGPHRHEQRLIPVGQLQEMRPPVGRSFNQPQAGCRRSDVKMEGPGANPGRCERGCDLVRDVIRQPGVGVQEDQDVAAGGGRTGIHLDGPGRLRPQDAGARRSGDGNRRVPAAAVDHDEFRRSCFREGRNGAGDLTGFVQSRDDDR
ncbi:MAG: hypothetical protein MZV70_62920, partial [Desulfobacterales bacterium]|nr:hypothetical protein [Desulfobacterales bacterium]